MLYQTTLSPDKVFEVYHSSCRRIQDWTQAIDFGPYLQRKPIKFRDDEPDGLGPCEHSAISTADFFELKKYQVDQDLEINSLFNQPRCMYYVDLQGNLLSNLKLSFYEQQEEAGFFSKMFSGDADRPIRDTLIKAYNILEEIYDDLLTPARLK